MISISVISYCQTVDKINWSESVDYKKKNGIIRMCKVRSDKMCQINAVERKCRVEGDGNTGEKQMKIII